MAKPTAKKPGAAGIKRPGAFKTKADSAAKSPPAFERDKNRNSGKSHLGLMPQKEKK